MGVILSDQGVILSDEGVILSEEGNHPERRESS
jgi:hypothetical protein